MLEAASSHWSGLLLGRLSERKVKINKPPSLAGLVALRGLGPSQQTAWTPKVIGKEPTWPARQDVLTSRPRRGLKGVGRAGCPLCSAP